MKKFYCDLKFLLHNVILIHLILTISSKNTNIIRYLCEYIGSESNFIGIQVKVFLYILMNNMFPNGMIRN